MDLTKSRAILIDVVSPQTSREEGLTRLEEGESLVGTYGGIVVVKTLQKKAIPDYKTFLTPGKITEIKVMAKELKASYLILNNALKYRQIYELSEALRKDKIQVWDRIDLILKIFAKHARTAEAKLEIELASIHHMGPRIYGMGLELSRQGGGVGTSGIGETNTEIMKRHLKEQARRIVDKLKQYQKVRAGHRDNRRRTGLKTVSIVGYTNAGKTSLLNRLSGRKEYVANELFATLDTRVGKIYLPNAKVEILITDTIGFIRDLPPELIKAFASTLSEAANADLLVHVIDAFDPKRDEKIQVVEDILKSLGLESTPKIYVFNKMDLLPKKFSKKSLRERFEEYDPAFVSTVTGVGTSELILQLEKKLFGP
ncbi:MAG: GTPase HflX [bacterium]